VVRTAKYTAVREEPQITLYFPVPQRPVHELTLHARVTGGTVAATRALADAAREVDPRVSVYDVGLLQDHIDARLSNERVLSVLSTLFAALALLVACGGLYASIAYSVARRTREIGVRLAVGAQGWAIVRLFIRETVVLVGLGVAAGLPLAVAAGRQFSALLYGVAPDSTPTLLGAAALLMLVSAVAAAFPASRAARTDPVTALRA
jgi:putative ABC transport system permease protein